MLHNKPLVFGKVELEQDRNQHIRNQDGIPKVIPKPTVAVVANFISH